MSQQSGDTWIQLSNDEAQHLVSVLCEAYDEGWLACNDTQAYKAGAANPYPEGTLTALAFKQGMIKALIEEPEVALETGLDPDLLPLTASR